MFVFHCSGIIAAMSLPIRTRPTLAWRWIERFEALFHSLTTFPWKSTADTLRERFREDRLGLSASSLTFTTTMALVPLVTVALAIFTAFPMFAKFQLVLEKWLLESLIPDNIARQVMGYLTQFAGQANKLGGAGVALLLVTALALVFTIDHTLNSIWRVRTHRPFGQRLLVYWAALTVGPLLLGVSLSLTSYAISASSGLVAGMPGAVELLLELLQYFMIAGGMAGLYHYVPNTQVKWTHAWAGGLFVSAGLEIAKRLLALYLSKVPGYSLVYGAFATVPIMLIWIYTAWVIVLWGAVIAAYLPSLMARTLRRGGAPGWQFELALAVLQQLHRSRATPARGMSVAELTQVLQVDALQLEPVLETLSTLDWVQQLSETKVADESRYVLLADPQTTPLAPLMQHLLLERSDAVEHIWNAGCWTTLKLSDAL
jgi:membrane protein